MAKQSKPRGNTIPRGLACPKMWRQYMPRRALVRSPIVAIALLFSSVLTRAPASAAADPQISLVAAGSSMTLERDRGEQVELDLGTYIVAGKDPFEIRVKRSSYHDPIVATQFLRPGRTRTLPTGLVADFRGLRSFLHLTLTDASGNR